MPMNRADYPADWEAVSLFVRVQRALHQCECTGQCGLHLPPGAWLDGPHVPGMRPRRCREINKQHAKYFNGRVILTAAHTCNCYPLCSNPDHLLAMCQRCHLRFDMQRHRDSRLRTISQPGYSARRYKQAGKQFGIEDLNLIVKTPRRKRTKLWLHP